MFVEFRAPATLREGESFYREVRKTVIFKIESFSDEDVHFLDSYGIGYSGDIVDEGNETEERELSDGRDLSDERDRSGERDIKRPRLSEGRDLKDGRDLSEERDFSDGRDLNGGRDLSDERDRCGERYIRRPRLSEGRDLNDERDRSGERDLKRPLLSKESEGRDFSDGRDLSDENSDRKVNDEDLICSYEIEVYPIGCDFLTAGHVSLKVSLNAWSASHYNPHLELICLVSVVDAEGGRRFPQSFTFTFDLTQLRSEPPDSVENYISRDTLLAAEDELLPQDTLTIEMEVVLREHYMGARPKASQRDFDTLVRETFRTEEGSESQPRKHYLSLKSSLAGRLRRESKFFQRLSDTPMFEKNSGYVRIPDGEYDTFLQIAKILWDLQIFSGVYSLKFYEILDIYALAHLYGIESVLHTCRCWLRLACRTSEHTSKLSRLADLYGDLFLREIAVGTVEKNEDQIESQGANLGKLYPGEQDREWGCITVSDEFSVFYNFDQKAKLKEKEWESGVATEEVIDISNSFI